MVQMMLFSRTAAALSGMAAINFTEDEKTQIIAAVVFLISVLIDCFTKKDK